MLGPRYIDEISRRVPEASLSVAEGLGEVSTARPHALFGLLKGFKRDLSVLRQTLTSFLRATYTSTFAKFS